MALTIQITKGSSNPNFMACVAGEPAIFSYQPLDINKVPENLSGRGFVLAIYSATGRTEVGYFDAAITTDPNGAPIAYWELDGSYTESFYGQALKWEVSERGSKGRDPILSGNLTIVESAPRILNLPGAPAGRYVCRVTRLNDPASSPAPDFTVKYEAYIYRALPGNTVLPVVSGTTRVGQTLNATAGTWTNSPTAYAYQWLRDGLVIPSATTNSYTLTSGDAGHILSVRVSATNADGTIVATSAGTSSIAALAPVFTTQPVISPTSGNVGGTFGANDGVAQYTTTYTRRWLLSGTAIGTASTVTPNAEGTLVLEVTATGPGGSVVATSAAVTVSAAGTIINPFLTSAQKMRAAYNAPRTVTTASSPPTVDMTNTGNSTINTSQSLAAGGATQTTAVPNGLSGPLDPSASNFWIVTKPPFYSFDTDYVGAGMIYAPGNSKRFVYNGRKFDFKATKTSSKSFSVWFSTDEANGWKVWQKASEDSYVMPANSQWALIDFGTAQKRAIEIIGEDELMQIYGFNFESTATASTFVDTMPVGMMFGDSYVYSQGSSQNSVTRNGQQATKGMSRKVAEYLGTLNSYNNGLRTNGFAQNRAGAQAYYHERLAMSGTTAGGLPRAEASHWGPLDWIIVPSTINDDGVTVALVEDNTKLAFEKLRAAQPEALILFPIGAQPPTGDTNNNQNNPRGDNSATHNARKAGFRAVFGSTPAEWVAAGAYMIDGTEAGENWVPSGSIGSSPYFPGSAPNLDGQTADYAHPNAAGHAFFAAKYAAGLIALCDAVIARGGSAGSGLATEDGGRLALEGGGLILLG